MAVLSWLSSSHQRWYPRDAARKPAPITLEGAVNEPLSLQVCVRLEEEARAEVHVDVAAPRGWTARVRRVGWVPLPHFNPVAMPTPEDCDGRGHVPGLVPDVLYDEASGVLGAGETHAFWVSLTPGRPAEPGKHAVRVTVTPKNGEAVPHEARLIVHPVRLKPRRNFPVTHWFYADALIDWYQTGLFDRRFWRLLAAYFENMTAHGLDTIYVPVLTPPLDGVKRPTQLLHVKRGGNGRYRFDWRDVKCYVDAARKAGFRYFEWTHLVTQWGAENAIRIYEGQGRDEKRLWPPSTRATSPTYRRFLEQFLPALQRFLERENLLDRSFFHVSDEPHGEPHLAAYRRARAMLAELAPWMPVMDALTDIAYAREGLTDMPVPSIRTALDFVAEGIPCWCYYCCHPREQWLNRLMDTPLPKIAMHGFLLYRWPFKGFLHWGYNYWYKSQTRDLIDPFTVSDGLAWERGWAYGDTFMVYPGAEGPLDSVRWEVFGEALRDYQLLQTVGVGRDDPLFAPLKSFQEFPKTRAWRADARTELFRRARG